MNYLTIDKRKTYREFSIQKMKHTSLSASTKLGMGTKGLPRIVYPILFYGFKHSSIKSVEINRFAMEIDLNSYFFFLHSLNLRKLIENCPIWSTNSIRIKYHEHFEKRKKKVLKRINSIYFSAILNEFQSRDCSMKHFPFTHETLHARNIVLDRMCLGLRLSGFLSPILFS